MVDSTVDDMVALADALRRDGHPVSVTDVADALEGLRRLAHPDDELVAGVLMATLGKYSPGARRSMGAEPDDGAGAQEAAARPLADRPSPPPSTRSRVSPFAHDDERSPAPVSGGADTAGRGPSETVEGHPARTQGQAGEASATAGTPITVDSVSEGAAGVGAFVAARASAPSTRVPFAPGWRPAALSTPGPTAPAPATFRRAARHLLARAAGAPGPRRPARVGTVDVARTVARAMQPGGSLLPPRRLAQRRTRPRLLVLADVSNSVLPTSASSLGIAAAAARASRHVRVLAVTDRVVEVTGTLRRRTETVRAGDLRSVPGVDPDALSDWGAAFTDLLDRLGRHRPRHLHVVVLGDGRSNGREPATDAFRTIVERVSSCRWFTPEPMGAWSLGDGEPAGYAAHATQMVSARGPEGVTAALTGHRS